MAQGKMKVKGKLPQGTKTKKGKAKGKAVTKRPNAPVRSKNQVVQKNKIKAAVTKMVNAAAEKQLRSMATDTPQLSAAQQRVATARTAPVVKK